MDDMPKSDEQLNLAEQTIRGEIVQVVYASEDGGYSVIRVQDKGGRLHTLVGGISGAHEGQEIEATGTWINHKEHGRQFKVSASKFTLPCTADGIKRYLSSGLIHGIGPKLAECIVDHFGDDALNVLDNFSARLMEVPGFGRKRLGMVREAWERHAREREVFIFLQSLGISMAYVRRIYRRYGDGSPEVVRNNPYILAEEVDGMGFVMSDKVAGMLGITGNDPRRLCSGVVYALNRLAESGHVCYPKEDFIKYAAELMQVEEKDALSGLSLAVSDRLAGIDAARPEHGIAPTPVEMVYKTQLLTAEKELAFLLDRQASHSAHKGRAILAVNAKTYVSLGPEQHEAVLAAGHYPLSIITGGPGVGKTTVVGDIVRRANMAKLKVYLSAPTGRAAKRLGESCRRTAMTIHRMLKWDPEKRTFVYNSKRPLSCDLLVVDEVSMLDIQLALFLFRAVAPGTTVILVGDSDQLPSVGPGTVLTDLILSGAAHVSHLSKIYRQGEGSRIVSNAHAVNSGRMPDLSPVPKSALSDFYWIEQDNPEEVVKTITNMVRDRIPQRFKFNPMRDIQVLTPMNRGSCGTKAMNEHLQAILNPDSKGKPHFLFGDRKFISGDRVMQIRNNYDKGVFNGDMGRLVFIDHGEKVFKVAFQDGDLVVYDFIEADQIVLAYAITVHKSQGSEFPAVIMPILTQQYIMLHRNLIYTGMTRAKKLMVIIGSKKALSMAVNNIRLEPRFSLLKARLLALRDSR
ncbi:MAG: ATP-dependent RecD-like DNA helicase [Victivallales bacterium]|nr:ATP-dependent RecD-like DNA helicase [Victivallales bacterium]